MEREVKSELITANLSDVTNGTKEMAIMPDRVAVNDGITDDLGLMTKSKQMALMPDLVFFINNDVALAILETPFEINGERECLQGFSVHFFKP